MVDNENQSDPPHNQDLQSLSNVGEKRLANDRPEALQQQVDSSSLPKRAMKESEEQDAED